MKTVNLVKAAKALGVSYSFAAALKKAAGVRSRLFDLARLEKWWKANPDFQIKHVYPRKPKSTNSLRAVA